MNGPSIKSMKINGSSDPACLPNVKTLKASRRRNTPATASRTALTVTPVGLFALFNTQHAHQQISRDIIEILVGAGVVVVTFLGLWSVITVRVKTPAKSIGSGSARTQVPVQM
jgi:hypothetical protein